MQIPFLGVIAEVCEKSLQMGGGQIGCRGKKIGNKIAIIKTLQSGKIYLCVLENTNCTNNESLWGFTLLIAYELHEYHPDGKIRVIRL